MREREREDLRGRRGEDGGRLGFAESNRDAMEAAFVGVPEVEPGGSVPGHKVSRRWRGGGGSVVFGGGGGGGGEDWVVLKGNPFHFFFGRDGTPLC